MLTRPALATRSTLHVAWRLARYNSTSEGDEVPHASRGERQPRSNDGHINDFVSRLDSRVAEGGHSNQFRPNQGQRQYGDRNAQYGSRYGGQGQYTGGYRGGGGGGGGQRFPAGGERSAPRQTNNGLAAASFSDTRTMRWGQYKRGDTAHPPHLLTLADLSVNQISSAVLEALALKQVATHFHINCIPPFLSKQTIALMFTKRSTRTRVASETAAAMLGAHSLFLGAADSQLGVNETLRDSAQVVGSMAQGIMARVNGHEDVEVSLLQPPNSACLTLYRHWPRTRPYPSSMPFPTSIILLRSLPTFLQCTKHMTHSRSHKTLRASSNIVEPCSTA